MTSSTDGLAKEIVAAEREVVTRGNKLSILFTLLSTIAILLGCGIYVGSVEGDNRTQDSRIDTVAGDVAKLERLYDRDIREMRQSLSRIETALGTKADRSELRHREER